MNKLIITLNYCALVYLSYKTYICVNINSIYKDLK